jgi:protein gp37
MENSKIQWCDHTFNPWIGCSKVSPGCLHCYAETLMDTRYGRVRWGAGNPRIRTAASTWRNPISWNRKAEMVEEMWNEGLCGDTEKPRRPRVFCASLADWLDPQVPAEWLADLLELINKTPFLDWLLLTKRPQNWEDRLAEASEFLHPEGNIASCWLSGQSNPELIPENVWIGATVEDQRRAEERIPQVLGIPARVHFLSCEPLLQFLCIDHWLPQRIGGGKIDWVICGGESGPGARPMELEWAQSLRDQCRYLSVPFLFKQWGEWAPIEGHFLKLVGKHAAGRLLDGVDHNEFPGAK